MEIFIRTHKQFSFLFSVNDFGYFDHDFLRSAVIADIVTRWIMAAYYHRFIITTNIILTHPLVYNGLVIQTDANLRRQCTQRKSINRRVT